MDYSASMQDDNPAGASPWGNSPTSSPRQNRTGFGSVLGSEPPTPPFRYNSDNGFSQQQEGVFEGQDSFRRPDTASTTSGAIPESEDSRPETVVAEDQPEGPSYAQDPNAPHAAQQAQVADVDSSAGPQGQQDQRPQQPQQPQFRLVAKVTGLERTGKKDPILRFDVHVCAITLLYGQGANLIVDQYSQVPYDTIPRCPPITLRVRQAR